MKTFAITNIRCWEPCYDPTRYLPADWQGTALDILAVEDCPARDRLWVVLREESIDAQALRLFAVWCARQALALIDNPDPRSVAAVDMAERFANGEATVDELDAARYAAIAAASAAAGVSAGEAVGDAARAAAEDAARAAASAAARAAAKEAQERRLVAYAQAARAGLFHG